jgi:hypothetical protein
MLQRNSTGIVGWARAIEASGGEISVRLLVHGVPIAGMVTSVLHFQFWVNDMFQMMEAAGSPMPSDTTAEAPTTRDIAEVKEA